MAAKARLPGEALARWRALEERAVPIDAIARVLAWLERLRARMLCSSGRLGRLLVATGLSDLESIGACVRAQLDAGTTGEGQFHTDVDADLDVVVELGSLELAEEVSAKVATHEWLSETAGFLHGDLAKRLVDVGRVAEAEVVLGRITWHGALLHWLDHHAESIDAELRIRLLRRAEQLVTSAEVAAVYQVDLFVQLGVLGSDRLWLDRAIELLPTLSREAIDLSGNTSPPESEIAWGFARLGALDDAMKCVAMLGPDERHDAIVRLLPLVPNGSLRTTLVDELFRELDVDDHRWWQIVDVAPEALDRIVVRVEALEDEELRLERLGYLVSFVSPEKARSLSEWMLGVARLTDPDSASFEQRWELALGALSDADGGHLLEEDDRERLIDLLLDTPESDLWTEMLAFIPSSRANAVLALSAEHLAAATHYTERDRWLSVGEAVLARVDPDQRAQWLEVAARQLPGTTIEGCDLERFAAFSPEQTRAIVLTRLAHHQEAFLFEWHIEPWLKMLRKREPIAAVGDGRERAEARRRLDALTETTAWPTFAQMGEVFDALARCAGDDALETVLTTLGSR